MKQNIIPYVHCKVCKLSPQNCICDDELVNDLLVQYYLDLAFMGGDSQ